MVNQALFFTKEAGHSVSSQSLSPQLMKYATALLLSVLLLAASAGTAHIQTAAVREAVQHRHPLLVLLGSGRHSSGNGPARGRPAGIGGPAHSLLGGLFHDSMTGRLLRESPIPALVLPAEDE